VGEAGGHPYIAMELVVGKTLTKVARCLNLKEKIAVLRDIAEATHAAHRSGLLHLDLKPGNVLMPSLERGELHPMVADFGLYAEGAGALSGEQTKVSIGTPPFSSPEQLMGDLRDLDRRSDIYALGVMLYTLLANALPFDAKGPEALKAATLSESPVPLRGRVSDVPEDLEAVVRKAMAKSKSARYDSAQSMADDLQRFLDGEAVQARPTTLAYQLRKWIQRHRGAAWSMGVASVLLVGVGVWAGSAVVRTRTQAARDQQRLQWAQDVEEQMRVEHMAPLHALTPTIQRLRSEAKAMEWEQARRADGAGAFALGRALVALGQEKEAFTHLNRAWDLGYRTPQSAFHLGLAKSRRYLSLMRRLKAIPDPQNRAQEEQRLDKELRQPALMMLSQAHALPDEAIYIEASRALLEGRSKEAIAGAKALEKFAPWNAEAPLLMAQASASLAETLKASGDSSGAAEAWNEAMEAMDRGLSVSRSDPFFFFQQADLYMRRSSAEFGPGTTTPWHPKAKVSIEMGIRANPEFSGLLSLKAFLLHQEAFAKLNHQEDADPALKEGVAAAREAVRLDPDDPQAVSTLCIISRLYALKRMRAGEDATKELEALVEPQKRAISLEPYSPAPHQGFSSLLNTLGNQLKDRGGDPLPYFEASCSEMEQTFQLAPQQLQRLSNILHSENEVIEELLLQGKDPSTHLAKTRETIERSKGTLDSNALFMKNKSRALRYQAQWEWEQGQDPQASLIASQVALEGSLRINPTQIDSFWERGEFELLQARMALKDPVRLRLHLRNATQAYERFQALAPGDVNGLLGLGFTARRASEGGIQEPYVDRGVKAMRQVMTQAPGVPEVQALLGTLLLKSSPEEGERLLRGALEKSPRLKHLYGPRI
jgi:eukaryotic-like serine/threonine-protein kinase